jgi:hypothetical protein
MIKENIEQIKKNIALAAQKAGRDPSDVTLIAVSKTYPVMAIKEAQKEDISDFGENKVQELMQKIPDLQNVKWHLIGHLQTNKVRYIIGQVALIHSVDSMRLAEEISRQAVKQNLKAAVLLEVNVAREASKHGFLEEELLDVVMKISRLEGIAVKGLMTVAPYVADPEENRQIFRKLFHLSVDIQKQNIDNISMDILSMGMSNDYQVAIEEGATMVRIGSAIFGQREYKR